MKTIPSGAVPYKKTAIFNESTVPDGFLKNHHTKSGVWGKIVILEGKLVYTIQEPEKESIILSVDHEGVVEPMIRHNIKPEGKVRFYLEFYR